MRGLQRIVAALSAVALAWIGTPGPAAETERPAAGGRLAWVLDGDLDLVGDIWAEVPVNLGPRDSLFLAVDTRTDMERPRDRFTFLLQDVQYALDAGWRKRRPGRRLDAVSLFVGQRGRDLVDRPGRGWVRYAGVGLGSRPAVAGVPDVPEAPPGWLDWRVSAAGVFDERGTDAEAIVRGEVRSWLGGSGAWALGFDLRFDGLVGDGGFRADVALGPRIRFPARGALASLFLEYQSSDHPLGRSRPLWLAGFAYEPRQLRYGDPGSEIDGLLEAGGGSGRGTGRVRVAIRSPAFRGHNRLVLDVDANVLASENEADLFYLYHVGWEHDLRRWVAGAFFYHRSNHVLDAPAPGITSINVVEAGLDSPRWDSPGRRRGTWAERIDFRARAGYVLSSAFGEREAWHVRAGLRSTLTSGATQPYVTVEIEQGDVERRGYALGLAPTPRLELQAQYRSDEQYFSRDRRAWLLTVRYGLGSRAR